MTSSPSRRPPWHRSLPRPACLRWAAALAPARQLLAVPACCPAARVVPPHTAPVVREQDRARGQDALCRHEPVHDQVVRRCTVLWGMMAPSWPSRCAQQLPVRGRVERCQPLQPEPDLPPLGCAGCARGLRALQPCSEAGQPFSSAVQAPPHLPHTLRHRAASEQVQHPGLRDSFKADAFTVETLVWLLKFIVPGFNYAWLVDEVKHGLPKVGPPPPPAPVQLVQPPAEACHQQHSGPARCAALRSRPRRTGLQELDFELETRNAQTCARNLAAPASTVRGRVITPAVHPALCSPRVVTMEYIDGEPAGL